MKEELKRKVRNIVPGSGEISFCDALMAMEHTKETYYLRIDTGCFYTLDRDGYVDFTGFVWLLDKPFDLQPEETIKFLNKIIC